MADYSAKNTNFSKLSKRVEELNVLMIAVVIVLLIGFATMFIAVFGIFRDSQAEKQATFQNLKNQVQSQNDKIDALTKAINEQKTLQKTN